MKNTELMPYNLSILDFKFLSSHFDLIKPKTYNLSILDFKFSLH